MSSAPSVHDNSAQAPLSSGTVLSTTFAPWLTCTALAAGLCAVTDVAVGGAGLNPRTLVSALGLAIVGGLFLGTGLSLLTVLGQRLPRRWGFAPWLATALGFALLLADSLNVRANLGGRYNALALAALCGSAALGGGLGFGGYALQAGLSGGFAWLFRRSRIIKWAAALGLLLSAALGTVLDRTQFPGLYPGAHLALRWSALTFFAYTLMLLELPIPRLARRWRLPTLAGIALLCLLPWLLLQRPNLAATATLVARPMTSIHLDLARAISDPDMDGYSSLLGGGDCAAFNAKVSPGNPEIPGNGLDDNCARGDAALGIEEHEDVPLPTEPSPVNVLLITIDTLRPDRMSAFGYERDTTPHLREWAENATRFDAAYTSGGWTSLAIPSLLAGRYPRRLSWNAVVETNKYRSLRPPLDGKLQPGEQARSHYLLPIDDPKPTLAMLLQRRGMYTAAVVDGGFTGILSPDWGFGRGFDTFEEVNKLPKAQRNDVGTRNLALKVLKGRPKDRPFFLWTHFFGPHAPSTAHTEVPSFGESEADKYDHEVAFVDLQVGALLAALDDITERPTVVVVTADHGERFYNERSRGHGRDAAEDSIRIPLLVKGQGLAPGKVDNIASLVDIMPTVLSFTRTPGPKQLDGVDLKQVAAGTTRERTTFIDTFVRDATGTGFKLDLVIGLNGKHKLVQNRAGSTVELNLRTDQRHPAKNLLPATPNPTLAQALDEYVEVSGGPPRILP